MWVNNSFIPLSPSDLLRKQQATFMVEGHRELSERTQAESVHRWSCSFTRPRRWYKDCVPVTVDLKSCTFLA